MLGKLKSAGREMFLCDVSITDLSKMMRGIIPSIH